DSIVLTGLTPGEQYSFRLVAVDQIGNHSAPSGYVSVTVTSVLEDPDLEDLIVDKVDDVIIQSGRHRVIYSSNTPSTDGKEVDGDTWFRIVGNDIVGQWNWSEALGWLTKAVGHQVISAIDAGKITVGALDGGIIKAGTVSADRLVVGGISNKIVDPFFQNSDINAVRCTTWQHNGLVEADPTNQRLVVKPGFSGWVSSTINPISFATIPYNSSGATHTARQHQLRHLLPLQH